MGAITRAGDNETSSRPPKDLGGALRYSPALAKRRYRRSYDAGQRRPEISPQPGGVANTAETQASERRNNRAAFLAIPLSMEKQRPFAAR